MDVNELAKIFYQIFSLVLLLISIVFVPVNYCIPFDGCVLVWQFFTGLGEQHVYLKTEIYIIQIISVLIGVLGFYKIIFKKF
jgi:hypothetical protein